MSYSSLKRDFEISNEGTHVQLVANQEEMLSVEELIKRINGDKYMISMDQILEADKQRTQVSKPMELLPLAADAMPVLVTDIQGDAPVQEEELDLGIQHDVPVSEGVVLIHRDVLDDEEAAMESAWGEHHAVVVQEAQVCENVGVSVQAAEEVVRVTRDNSERQFPEEEHRDDHRRTEGQVEEVNQTEEVEKPVEESENKLVEEQEISPQNLPAKPTKPSKKSKKEKPKKPSGPIDPKAHIVVVDSTIPSTVRPTEIREESQHADNSYVDLSSQMINDMNQGFFDSVLENENVTVTYVH